MRFQFPSFVTERSDAREEVVQWCRAQGLTPYDRRSGEGLLRNLVVREGRRTGQIQVRLVTTPGKLDREGLAAAVPNVAGLLWTQLRSVAEVTQGGETELIAGVEKLEEELAKAGIFRVKLVTTPPKGATARRGMRKGLWPGGSSGIPKPGVPIDFAVRSKIS